MVIANCLIVLDKKLNEQVRFQSPSSHASASVETSANEVQSRAGMLANKPAQSPEEERHSRAGKPANKPAEDKPSNEDMRSRAQQTPLADAFLAMMAEGENTGSPHTTQLCTELATMLWFGKLWDEWKATITPGKTNLERLLATVQMKRDSFLQVLAAENDRRATTDGWDSITLTNTDMVRLHNRWMNDVEAWMLPDVLQHYHALRAAAAAQEQEQSVARSSNTKGAVKGFKGQGKGKQHRRGKSNAAGPGQTAQQLKKSRFNTYCFKLSGSKAMLFALIQYPSYSTPAGLQSLLHAWQEHKQTDEYQKLLWNSRKSTAETSILKKAAHKARRAFARAHQLSAKLHADGATVSYWNLHKRDQELIDGLVNGSLAAQVKAADAQYGHSAATKYPGLAYMITK